ncbi:MAG: hypothetical protein ACRD5K_17285 [Candidatus Acidiferrales bacterium]
MSTVSVGSQVTALAISAAQNEWVYTSISPDRSTYQIVHAAITTSSPTLHAEATLSTADSDFVVTTIPGTPPPFLESSVVLSSNMGNGIAVTTTPTGFAVVDIVSGTTLISGTTASPVRGIALDTAQSIAYLTEPESNTTLTVPIPAPTPLTNEHDLN